SEERLRLIARASGDVVWDWDLRNDTIWWSDNYAEVFGHRYDRDAPSGLSWSQYIHPDDYTRVMNDVEHAIAQGSGPWSAYYRLRHVDGHYVRVHDRGYVVRDADGRPLRMLGATSDITRQAALEDQLRQMQRLEAIGRLTGGIAHDFNNLLTVILGNAEVLASGDDNDERRALAEMIASAALRGAELTARLLAFARKQALDPIATDVVVLLAAMQPLLRRTLGEQVDLRFVHDAAPRAALIDPGQLE